MDLIIDKTPLPNIISSGDFADMKINDSVFIPTESNVQKQQVRGAASYASKRNVRKYICRSWNQDGISGIRVWRVS